MFHIAKDIYSNIKKKEEYSVLVLGIDDAGKTTFIEKLKELYLLGADGKPLVKGAKVRITPPERIMPTVGQNVTTIKINKVLLKFWDLGGQQALRPMWANYYDQCHCIVFVVDSRLGHDEDKRAHLTRARQVLMDITKDEVNRAIFDRINIPILMLANKQDHLREPSATGTTNLELPEEMPYDDSDCIELFELKETFNDVFENLNAIDSKILPISATSGYGIKQAMDWLTVRLTRNKQNVPPNYK